MKKLFTLLVLFVLSACSKAAQPDEIWIKNSNNENLYLQIDGLDNTSSKKLAFIQHGLASNMNHQAVQTVKQVFLDHHYVVVTFDSRYSLGNSGNDVQKVSLSSFEEDLETVINWAKEQPFYSQPFALSGHSLGGASVLQYGAKHAESVNFLIPITPVISGDLWETSCMKNMPDFCRKWKKDGFYEYVDKTNQRSVVIPYGIITHSKSYNAYSLVPTLKAKTLVIAAQNDKIIEVSDAKKLNKFLKKGDKVVVINDSGHNFVLPQNQKDLYSTISDFLQ